MSGIIIASFRHFKYKETMILRFSKHFKGFFEFNEYMTLRFSKLHLDSLDFKDNMSYGVFED